MNTRKRLSQFSQMSSNMKCCTPGASRGVSAGDEQLCAKVVSTANMTVYDDSVVSMHKQQTLTCPSFD